MKKFLILRDELLMNFVPFFFFLSFFFFFCILQFLLCWTIHEHSVLLGGGGVWNIVIEQ